MRATIKDIAEKAGLSITTVSLVLNGRKCRTSDETRALILRIADEMNYSPNQLARGLVCQQSNTIGLILPSISNIYFSELARSVEGELRKNGFHVMLCSSDESRAQDTTDIKMLINKNVDGIIYAPAVECDDQDISENCELAKRSNTPLVLIDRVGSVTNVNAVMLDNELGGYLATKHLIDMGHRRIGFLTGCKSLGVIEEARLVGAKRALTEAGLTYDTKLVFAGGYSYEGGCEGAGYFYDKPATAVFCFNDIMACAFIKKLHELGREVPEDMSVVGFDDIYVANLLTNPLTTVHQPIFAMGVAAANIILENVSEPDMPCRRKVFTPSLTVRKSVAKYTQK